MGINNQRIFISLFRVFIYTLFVLSFVGCGKEQQNSQTDLAYKEELEQTLFKSTSSFSADSIRELLKEKEAVKDETSLMILYRVLGKKEREESHFSESIRLHRLGLEIAYNLNDTIEIIRALNNLGTDCRRLGMLPEAESYHYKALLIADAYSQKDELHLRKGRTYALNGIGNIALTINLLDTAECYFRRALKEEVRNENVLGQAINYANIGAVFEIKQNYDSARCYYSKSMEKNLAVNSKLGIALCYIHFGKIYDNTKEYNRAEAEYNKAYKLLEEIRDRWHWLEACLAIVRLKMKTARHNEILPYLHKAKQVATDINSLHHLADIHYLLYQYNLDKEDYFTALTEYRLNRQYSDSIQGDKRINQIIDARIHYEKEKNKQNIEILEGQNRLETKKKKLFIFVTFFLIVVLGGSLILLYRAFLQSRKSNKVLKDLEQLRSDFFTKITHEFRTPLTVILGLSRQLKNNQNLPPSSSLCYLKSIERQGENLLELVNQLLDIKRLQGAVIGQLEWRRGNIVVYLNMLTEAFRLYAMEQDIRVIFESKETQIETEFVPDYIHKIFQNLLFNAIKYSKKGGKVLLTVELKNKGKAKETILVKVIDEGEGISKENIQRIFELFYQVAKNKDNHIAPGTGVGLTLTKQLVEALEGEIYVDSEVGSGSTFSVELPVRDDERRRLPRWFPDRSAMNVNDKLNISLDESETEKNETKAEDDMRTTILLVEDNKDVALYIKTLFPEHKYSIEYANNGEEGFSIANNVIPDIVITDVMMPVMNGLDMCEKIRKSPLLNHIPIIILTAKTTTENQIEGLKCGADAYITKPFYAEELQVRVEKLLENRNLLKEKYCNAIFKEEYANDGTNIDKNDINIKYLQMVTSIIYRQMKDMEFTSQKLADELSVSISQLNKKLKVTTGYSSSNYILLVKINHAKKLLSASNSSKRVSEVAEDCGFADLSYFTRVFKRMTGVTPSQFKQIPLNVEGEN